MKITGITLDQFRVITGTVSAEKYAGNVTVHQDADEIYRARSGIRPACRARLTVLDSYGPGSRVTASVHPVTGRPRHGRWACWHAYRDVLQLIFDWHPDTVIVTGLTAYRGRAGFMELFPATGAVNMGSRTAPVFMPELCKCTAGYLVWQARLIEPPARDNTSVSSAVRDAIVEVLAERCEMSEKLLAEPDFPSRAGGAVWERPHP